MAGSADAPRIKGKPVRSYRTTFNLDEDPISEGGAWLNGGRDGIDWCNVITRGGKAYGAVSRHIQTGEPENPTLDIYGHREAAYDDPTAVLSGSWGRNQHGKARVFSKNQTDLYYQEVEIRLRSMITPHSCTGYEVFWRCLSAEGGYAQIVRWNGKAMDWVVLQDHYGAEFGVKDGDLIEATVVGNVIKGFVNGQELITATDDVFSSGNPGIGFNYGVGDTNVDHGFTSFEVDTFDD
jgi:hypothetical protein